MVKKIHLPFDPFPCDHLEGKFLGDGSYDLLVGSPGPLEGPVEVYRKDGALLLKYFPGALTQEVCAGAFEPLLQVKGEATNRSVASGIKIYKPRKENGEISRTNRIKIKDFPFIRGIGSGVVGSIERTAYRLPMCRLTSFTRDKPGNVEAAMPFFQEIDNVFAQGAPERYAAQLAMIEKTDPAWRLGSTAFTTVTVNKDFRTATHQDKGDLAAGFGVLSVLRSGRFKGCFLVFPEFRVAVDLQTRGVLLCDVHRWHGNTPMIGKEGTFARVACVLYYREKMVRCGSPAYEVEKAANRVLGDPMWSPEEIR